MPIDLQDHFEVFGCLFCFYVSLLLCSRLPAPKFGGCAHPPACIPYPELGLMSLFRPLLRRAYPPYSWSIGGFMRLIAPLCHMFTASSSEPAASPHAGGRLSPFSCRSQTVPPLPAPSSRYQQAHSSAQSLFCIVVPFLVWREVYAKC